MAETIIEIKNLHKYFGKNEVLKGIDLDIKKGEGVVIIGPSGSGKSTFLRSMNLLEKPTKGVISFEGVDITDKNNDIFKMREKMGMVFQQFNLFPNMTVKENITLSPIKTKGVSKADAEAKAMELLEKVGLKDKADAYPTSLSGGQQQRVFLAMTLAQDAELVLLDEPTTYLDLNRQAELMGMMRQMQQNGKTVITVLHDLNQACRYCDYLIVMKKGAVMAQGTPDEVMTEELLKDVFDLDVIIHRDPISNTPMFILK